MRYGLVSREQAEDGYGVVLTADNQPDVSRDRDEARRYAKEKRGAAPRFDFGYTPPERLEAAE